MLLAGDIGGTKTGLAIIDPVRGLFDPVATAALPSNSFDSLETLVQAFIAENPFTVEYASFGVAGPVVAGKAAITNLPWVIEADSLRRALRVKEVRLLNDLESIGFGIPALRPEDIVTLNAGSPVEHGAIAVIAPGTGLGEGYVTFDGQYYRAHPSEGGHVDFAPANDLQIDLLRFLQRRLNHVSYEWVCSGMGIPYVYRFLRDGMGYDEPDWLAEKLASVQDKTPVISRAAFEMDEPPPICVKTMELFIEILGAEAGNLALKVLATGGVYLAGGIPPRILEPIRHGGFMEAFLKKGRFSQLLSHFPVRVVMNPQTALIGAATQGLQALGRL